MTFTAVGSLVLNLVANQSDVFFIRDDRDLENPKVYAVYSFVDIASTYHQAGIGKDENPTAEEQKNKLETLWFQHYGPPEFYLCDGGPEQSGEPVKNLMTFYDVKTHVVAASGP